MSKYVPLGLSPLPWVSQGRALWHESAPGVGGPDPQPPEGSRHADFEDPGDAAYAAHAANTHERLCLALEKARLSLIVYHDHGAGRRCSCPQCKKDEAGALLAECAAAARKGEGSDVLRTDS